MVFLQKLSADGPNVITSALIGRTVGCNSSYPYLSAKADGSGSVYLAFGLPADFGQAGDVAGDTTWGGDPGGGIAVLKISSSGDKVLYATKAFPNALASGPFRLGVDDAGFAYLAFGYNTQIQFAKIGPTGVLTHLSYVITEPVPEGIVYDEVSLAVGADHSLYVASSPNHIYRIDAAGEESDVSRVQLGGGKTQSLDSIGVDAAGNAYVVGSTLYQDGMAPIPVTPMGFSQALPGSTHSFLIKVNPSGAIAYGRAFDPANLTAVAVDKDGNAWAGGGAQFGFTVFELDEPGTSFLHYISLPDLRPSVLNAGDNQIKGITLDRSGQALIAGATASLRLPYSGAGEAYGVNDEGNLNAFFFAYPRCLSNRIYGYR